MGMKSEYITMKVGESEFIPGGDFILKFDNILLNTSEYIEKLQVYFNRLKEGLRYKIIVFRNGEIKELNWHLRQKRIEIIV